MKKEMSKMDVQAKMDVLKELYDMCSAKLKDKVKGGMDEMKQVTVAAPDAEGLEEGLEMAAQIAPEMEEMSEEKEEPTSKIEDMLNAKTMDDEEEDSDSMFNAARKKRMSKEY